MFVLIPACDRSVPVAEISLALLERWWPDHPAAEVLHHSQTPRVNSGQRVRCHDRGPDGSRWLGTVRDFLREQSDELFLLLLDDYALCGPAKVDVISRAEQMMTHESSIGLFALSWYPAAKRTPWPGWDGMETLTGTPILLQAAIWRRTWFLKLAEGMDDRTSPWSFEGVATQRAKRDRMEVCAARMPVPRQTSGHFIDGLDKTDWALPYHNLMHRGQPALEHEAFLRREGFAFPSCGLGDSVARITRATGVATVVERISAATGRDCGCQRRRGLLNRVVPYGR